jgi:hypothetical protein
MDEKPTTFAEWIIFEADRIVGMGLRVPEEHQADYMRVQIQAALRKAVTHGRDGLSDEDPPRAVRKASTDEQTPPPAPQGTNRHDPD